MESDDDEPVFDPEDDIGMEIDPQQGNEDSDEEPVMIESDGSDDPVIHSDDDQGDNVANPVGANFVLNIEANGLDDYLRVEGAGNLQAWEQLLLIVAKTLRFKECYRSMIASCKITNLGYDNAHLPEDMRHFWRIVNRTDEMFTSRVVCTVCWDIIGEGKEPTMNCTCGRCGLPPRKNVELGSYLYTNLRSLFEGLLNKPDMANHLQYPYTRVKRNNNAIEDVYDCSEYTRRSVLGGFLHRDNHNYSLVLWADGVSPFGSSGVQIVPVFLQVLELSPRARQRNSILAGVYVGPRKVLMSQYLAPITLQLGDLYLNGVNWRPTPNEEWTSRFMLLMVSADSEERYRILEMTRHNGHFGCTYCLADATPIGDGNHRLVYGPETEDAPDRTNHDIRENARQAVQDEESVNGVKGLSALYPIPVDLRAAQLIEGLHLFWEGNFVRLKNNCTNAARPNSIAPRHIATISERILNVRTPTKLSRLPRGLEHFEKYTGTEYRNTSWYTWLPCANEFLDDDQRRLFSIFAEATFILNKDSILPAELDRAENLLDEYRTLFRNTYPREEWVYNVHLLKHAVRSVRELGPAWVGSAFWFESLNRQVVNYLTSPTDRASQLACRMLLGQMVEQSMDLPMSPRALSLLREFTDKERWEERPEFATGTYVQIKDPGRVGLFQAREIAAIEEAGLGEVPPQLAITRFGKICIDGVVYQERGDRITKYNNSIAHVEHVYEHVEFIEIHSIVTWQRGEEEERTGVFGIPFHTTAPAFDTTYMKIVEKLERNFIYLDISNIITPGVLVETGGRVYISRLPNRWDND